MFAHPSLITLEPIDGFYEIWYEYCTIGGCPVFVLTNYTTVMVKMQTSGIEAALV
jgi:uncharacterized protein YutD